MLVRYGICCSHINELKPTFGPRAPQSLWLPNILLINILVSSLNSPRLTKRCQTIWRLADYTKDDFPSFSNWKVQDQLETPRHLQNRISLLLLLKNVRLFGDLQTSPKLHIPTSLTERFKSIWRLADLSIVAFPSFSYWKIQGLFGTRLLI